MKKLSTIIFAGLLSAFSVKAQHSVDLEVTMPYPVYHQLIAADLDLLTDVVITNVGNTTFDADDSVQYAYTIEDEIINFKWQGDMHTTFYLTGRELAPGDTMHITRVFKLKFPAEKNGIHLYCVKILHNSGTPDPDVNNNDGCQIVYLTGGGLTSSVSALESSNAVLQLSPNPANELVNINLDLVKKSEVSVKLLDIAGRVVTEQDYSVLSAGEHTLNMQIGNVPQGLYMYQVQMGDVKSSGKLLISK